MPALLLALPAAAAVVPARVIALSFARWLSMRFRSLRPFASAVTAAAAAACLRAAVVPRFATRGCDVGLALGGGCRLCTRSGWFRCTGGRNRITQLRKNFLQHMTIERESVCETPGIATPIRAMPGMVQRISKERAFSGLPNLA